MFLIYRQTNTIVGDTVMKEQNDLNRNGTYHQNVYQQLDKLNNPLVAKKLETTEL